MIVLGLILILAAIIAFAWPIPLIEAGKPIKADKVGQFGDFVGGVVGTLFSLTGVILFYVALKEQRKDFKTNAEILRLQKKELQLQRKELIETRKVFEKQSLLMQEQKNDTRFFSLLENHKEMVASFTRGELRFGGGSSFSEKFQNSYTEPVTGYEILDRIAEEWKDYFKLYDEAFKKKRILSFDLAKYEDCLDIMRQKTIASLHFRELHNLYLFIQEKLNNDEFYLNTLNVNLTHNERYLFEAAYNYFPAEVKGLNYKSSPSYFKKRTLINFETDILPKISTERAVMDRNYNWIFIHSDEELKDMKLIIYSEKNSVIYHVEDVVELQKENAVIIQKTNLFRTSISFEKALIKSNLNVHEFPFYDKDSTQNKHFIFDITAEKNGEDFHFYFKYHFDTHNDYASKPLLKYELRNTKVSEIDEATLHHLMGGMNLYRDDQKTAKPEQPLLNKVNSIIQRYFNKHGSEDKIEATVLNTDFVENGIFREDEGKSAINKFLRELDKKGQLEKIPFAFSEKKGQKNLWYFGRNGKPLVL